MPASITGLSACALAIGLSVGPTRVAGQSAIAGRVLRAADTSVIAGASVRLLGSESHIQTTSDGRYELKVAAGSQRIIASAVGVRPETLSIVVADGTNHRHDFLLSAVAELLPAVGVTTTPQSRTLQLSGFYDRQSAGIGAFITPENIKREEGRQVGEIVAKYSRVSVRYGGSHAWLATNRSSSDGGCAFCKKAIQELLDQADINAGARPACYMDVYLDGQAVYRGYGQDSHSPRPLFDLNSLNGSEIEGIEIYASAVQIPARFNATSGGCGVAIIWTKH
jgi:hypothetical protein